MPTVNTRVSERVDADRSRGGQERIAERSADQAVQVRDRGSATEVQPRERVTEAPRQQAQQVTQAQPSYADQLASRDTGSLARTQQTEQRTQAEPRQQTQQRQTVAAEMAGLRSQAPQQQAPAEQAPRPAGVPVVHMPDAPLDVMSSRSPKFDEQTMLGIHESLAETGAQMAAARIQNTPLTSMEPIPTRFPSDVRREHRQQTETRQIKQDGAATETQPDEATQSVINDKPSNIFNRSFGWNGKSREVRTKQPSMRRNSSAMKAVKNAMARAFKRSGVGYRIYQKINGKKELDLREVGIGLQEIMAAIEQNPGMVNNLFSRYAGEEIDVTDWDASDIVKFVRSHATYVGTFKPPNNQGPDVQRRRLRILTDEQRGIYLHPIMTALYTADNDGDDMEVSLDPNVTKLARDPMSYMVNIDGMNLVNMDFFPVATIVSGYAEGKTERDYVREVMLSKFANIDGRTIRPLVDAILRLGESATNPDIDPKDALSQVFREARRVADATSKRNPDIRMSEICQAVYDGMQRLRIQNALTTIDADIVGFKDLPGTRTYDDEIMFKLVDGMVKGDVPNNFQELKVMLSGFLGNVKGKNAPFRFTADVGKMMKMDSRLKIGDGSYSVDLNDDTQMELFFESTVKYMGSRRMAKEIKAAGRSQYYTQVMRENVINEVGFPTDVLPDGSPRYQSYGEFLDAFYRSYNVNSSMINEANLIWLTNNGISKDSNRGLVSPLNPSRGGVTLGDIAEPMISIYGTYSVGRMFQALSTSGIMGEGNRDTLWSGDPDRPRYSANRPVRRDYDYEFDQERFWIRGKYLDYTLRQFKNENRLIRGDSGMNDVLDKDGSVLERGIRNTLVSSVSKMDDVTAQFRMLMAIADKRTSTASKFNKSVYGTMEGSHSSEEKTTVMMMAKLLTELDRLDSMGGHRDQMLWINDVVDTLIESGPDMFTYFDMDSPAGFLQTDLAKKMVEHRNDVEVLGGIRTAMVFDYRMERITDLTAKMPDPNDDIDQYAHAYNNLEFARDELAAASEVWRGILREFDAEETAHDKSVFQMMHENASMDVDQRLVQQNVDGSRKYVWKIEYDAKDFWANPGGHTTLRSVIEDLDLDRRTKWNVIADVVRYWEQDPYLKSYEVGYQLEIGNDSSYSLGSAGSQGALSVHRDFEQAFNRWGKTSQEKMQKEVTKASEKYRNKRGYLMRTIERLDKNPEELVFIDDRMYADSILSVKDKTYAQTEKGSQHPWTNKTYSALCLQQLGGYMNDVTRTDDRLLGSWSSTSVSIQDLVHLLADPEAEMVVYNEYGEYTILSRHVILSNALGREIAQNQVTESDIWDFLEQNPRIASAIRMHNACTTSDADGSGYLGAALSMKETIKRANSGAPSPISRVKYLMRNHPQYAAIVSLASPGFVKRMTDGEISEFRGDNYFLSNFYPTPVTIDDITYRNAEAAFQAQKCANQSDKQRFVNLDGKDAKKLGRKIRLRSDWESVKEGVMRQVISAKFSNPELRRMLTSTGNANLVESNTWGDTTWGSVNGVGRNLLGEILMDERGNSSSVVVGSVTRNERRRIVAIEDYLAHQIYRYASSDASSTIAAQEILRDMGITYETLSAVLRPGYDSYCESLGIPVVGGSQESDNEAMNIFNRVSTDLTSYVNEIRNKVNLGIDVSEGTVRPNHMGVDITSVASYWDVVQELSGAKTAVSTGVEGAETYQFAEWASHISAKDKFADLAAIDDSEVDASWNGMWTSLRDKDGNYMTIRVDEDGTSNIDEILDMAKEQETDEVVCMVPDGYDVRDRSTDSHGNPVPSLFIYMVSKRSNGAEGFNLKAKKSGIDGKDSITKMDGKHRMITDPDTGETHPANLIELRDELRTIAQENGDNGLVAAKMELANRLLRENNDLGYNDLTLANYLCIADLMLIQGSDGQIYLRSLEMLFNAIKHRLGPSVDEMSEKERTAAINAIVQDVSETGVGIATMYSPLEALDKITPKSKSSSFDSIRPNMSVFDRNYDLLKSIETDAKVEGIAPISPALAQDLTNRYTDKDHGIVADVVGRIDAVRNHSIVGYAGIGNGMEQIQWTIGPSNAIVIGDGNITPQRVAEICNKAYDLGMTVIVSVKHRNEIPSDMIADAVISSQMGDVILPCFDMRLNGSEAMPYNGGRFAIFQAPFSRYTTTVEDPHNFFELGDAQYKVTTSLTDRTSVIDNGSQQVKAEDLFPNVFRNKDFANCSFEVSLAEGDEIANLIAKGVTCTIDYGVVEGGRGFDQRVHDVDAAIERYQSRWSEADPDGVIRGGMTECEPGDIVGWAECVIIDDFTGDEQIVLAPIIPFPLHGSTKGIPEKFTVEKLVTVDDDNTLFAVDWTNTTSLENGFAKYFDSSGGANKGMINFTDAIDTRNRPLNLRNGVPVDTYCAKASTDSRKIGTDRRVKTMITLMAQARMNGYNFAKVEDSFPNNPDVKERLLRHASTPGGVSSVEWRELLREGDFVFCTDQRMNAFLNYESRKILADGGNPSDYLACVYEDESGAERNTHVMWEFEAMFDQGIHYEDSLLRFLHSMDEKFCPNGVDDDGEYLFRLARDGEGLARDYNNGVLEMSCPYPLDDGSVAYLWANVYTGMSFFGEDYSGFSRPNVDGASNFLDAMNTMSYLGAQLDETSARYRAMWASSDIGRIARDGGALGKA